MRFMFEHRAEKHLEAERSAEEAAERERRVRIYAGRVATLGRIGEDFAQVLADPENAEAGEVATATPNLAREDRCAACLRAKAGEDGLCGGCRRHGRPVGAAPVCSRCQRREATRKRTDGMCHPCRKYLRERARERRAS